MRATVTSTWSFPRRYARRTKASPFSGAGARKPATSGKSRSWLVPRGAWRVQPFARPTADARASHLLHDPLMRPTITDGRRRPGDAMLSQR